MLHNRQPITLMSLLLSLILLCTSCITKFDLPRPAQDAAFANPNLKFTILGPVSVNLAQSGYTSLSSTSDGVHRLLLKEARRSHNEVHAVINIQITEIRQNDFLDESVSVAEGMAIKFEE